MNSTPALPHPPLAAATSPPPLGRRVLGVFLAPRALFEEIRAEAPWIGPLAISVAVALLVLALTPDEHFVAQAREAAELSRRGPVELTSDPARIALFERLRLGMGVLMVRPILALLIAGALALVFSVLLRGDAVYRQYLSVTTHALLITALGALAALPLQVARGDAYAEPSLALLAPFLTPESTVARIFGAVNPFTLWTVAVLAVGVAVVNRQRSPTRTVAILVGAYLALAVGAALLAG